MSEFPRIVGDDGTPIATDADPAVDVGNPQDTETNEQLAADAIEQAKKATRVLEEVLSGNVDAREAIDALNSQMDTLAAAFNAVFPLVVGILKNRLAKSPSAKDGLGTIASGASGLVPQVVQPAIEQLASAFKTMRGFVDIAERIPDDDD